MADTVRRMALMRTLFGSEAYSIRYQKCAGSGGRGVGVVFQLTEWRPEILNEPTLSTCFKLLDRRDTCGILSYRTPDTALYSSQYIGLLASAHTAKREHSVLLHYLSERHNKTCFSYTELDNFSREGL